MIDAPDPVDARRPVDASIPDAGGPPSVCEAADYVCGEVVDSSGNTVSCGTCGSGTTCVDHQCLEEKPRACAEAGATCGTIDDGQGGTIDCGGCTAPAVCGGNGRANLCAVPPGIPPTTQQWEWLSPSPLPMDAVDSFAIAADNVWAVGDDGAVRHFDGTAWAEVAGGTNFDLNAVWGTSQTDVWIAGDRGALLHWDGEVFVPVVAGQGDADLEAIDGTGPADVWIVGDEMTLHYDGTAWSRPDQTTPSLHGLFVAAQDDVWAIGEDLIWRFDDTAGWDSLPQYAGIQRLRGIYGRSPDEIYVVGYFAKQLECDDELVFKLDSTGQLESLDTASDGSIQGIYGSADQVVAVRSADFCHGSSVYVLAGEPGLADPPLGIATATQLDANRQFMLGGRGQPYAYDGATWTSQYEGTYSDLTRLTVVNGEPWALIYSIAIVEWRGENVVPHLLSLPADSILVSISGTTSTDVWALDRDATRNTSGPLWHWNGTAWGNLALPDPTAGYHAVFALSEGVVELAGAGIYRHQDDAWTELLPPDATTTWRAIAHDPDGALWAAGIANGSAVVVTEVSEALMEMPIPALTNPCAIAAVAADDVWVAGADGVAHWDGAAWSTMALTVGGGSCSIAAQSSDDVYVAGYGGGFYHYDGIAWAPLDVLPSGRIHSVATGLDGVYAAGSQGQLLRHP